jgi:metal-responsive CopG/Arc/MetJ family transcriptional regulator
MRVVVSIPDEVLERADRLKNRLGVSRSRLFVHALEELIARHDDIETTDCLNAVYSQHDSSIPPDLRRLRDRSLRVEDW